MLGGLADRARRVVHDRLRGRRPSPTLVVFSILIVFMLVRPQGLLGRAGVRRSDGRRPSPAGPRIGADEWVAIGRGDGSHAVPRRRSRRGRFGIERGRPGAALARRCSSAPPRSCPSSPATATCCRVGFDTLLYMLLALGLNVVVGWARAARPRLRRLLRLRRLHVRDPRLRPVRPPRGRRLALSVDRDRGAALLGLLVGLPSRTAESATTSRS